MEIPVWSSLADRVALVTGCGSPTGIGIATARALGELGATVVITATGAHIHDRVEELSGEGFDVHGIPIDLSSMAGVLASLRVFRRRQQEERLRLGQVLSEGDYVVCDELGQPIHPDTYSAWFRRLAGQAGLPVIRLHDARRTAATLLSTLYGVSGDSAASYLGHDPVTFHRTYVLGEKGHEVVKDALSRMQTGTDSGKW